MSLRLGQDLTIEKEFSSRLTNTIVTLEEFKTFFESIINQDLTEASKALFAWAAIFNVSDIHFEPEKDDVIMRFRIDGLLNDAARLSHDSYKKFEQRLRLMANIKLNIGNKAQDGGFTVMVGDNEIECRASIIPANFGNSLVIRVLNPQNIIDVAQLGIRPDIQKNFEKAIASPNGLILVTGPTGSGKTTTLYAILKKLQDPAIKIITIEDPIEYKIPQIVQTQVSAEKGYTFAEGLRSVVRQDPDVILVGEIRDEDTCKTAMQAALTGHLVLATLHTNDAVGTINRLLSLGENQVNIGPALNLVIAQRLVRKICPACHEKSPPTNEELDILKDWIKETPDAKVSDYLPDDLMLPRLKGCQQCNFSGYKGRTGIYEMFFVNDEMKQLIIENQSAHNIRSKAIEAGMTSIKFDGAIKIINKITTLEEVKRVVGD